MTAPTVTTGAVGELTVIVFEDWRSSAENTESLPCKCPDESIAVTESVFVPGDANVANALERYVAVTPSAAQETWVSGSMVDPQSALKSACADAMSVHPLRSRISVSRTTVSIPLEISDGLLKETVRTCGTTLIATDQVLVTERNPEAVYVTEKSNVLNGYDWGTLTVVPESPNAAVPTGRLAFTVPVAEVGGSKSVTG